MKLLLKTGRMWLENKDAVVLKDVSMEISKGELLWLEGPSGSGKSMLLEALAFRREPARGTIVSQEKYPLCSESSLILPGDTAAENIRLSMKSGDAPESTFDTSVLMKKMNLFDVRNRRAGELSSGERKMLLLATFLALDCEMLLFDEPLAGLDGKSRAAFTKAALEKSFTGCAVFAASTEACPVPLVSGARRLFIKENTIDEE